MSRKFSMIAPAIWQSTRFNQLDTEGKLTLFYLMTSHHMNFSGCCYLPDGYAAHDLGWPVETYEKARDQLVEHDLISFRKDTDEVFIKGWFRHCQASTSKQYVKGIMTRIGNIKNDSLREEVEAEFAECSISPSNENPLDSSFDALGNPVNGGSKLANTSYMRARP